MRIYDHEAEPLDLEPFILITELEDNEGESIVSSAEVVVGKLLAALQEVMDLSDRRAPTFVFHYPPETTKAADYYELVTFEDLGVEEMAIENENFLGSSSKGSVRRVLSTVGEASFSPLDSQMVRALLEEQTGI